MQKYVIAWKCSPLTEAAGCRCSDKFIYHIFTCVYSFKEAVHKLSTCSIMPTDHIVPEAHVTRYEDQSFVEII